MEIKRVSSDIARKLEVAINGIEGLSGKVGWFEKSRYPEDQGGDFVAEIAAQNEYGNPSKNIPPRPFMRTTIIEKQNDWRAFAEKLAEKVLKDNLSPVTAMTFLAVQAENDVLKKIKSITSPPLAPATIAARLSRYKDKKTIGLLTKPLVDTGLMIATLTHEVSKT